VRTKRRCGGYRDEVDLIFRNTDAKPKGKTRKSGTKSRSSKCLSPAAGSDSSHDLTRLPTGKESHFLLRGIGTPSKDDLPLCFFYQTTLESLTNADRARYLHLQLPTLFSRSEAESALHLAVQAISLAVWARSRPNDRSASQLSRTRYSQALAAMNAAIRDPAKVKCDETLYAVLLLSGYEVRVLQLRSWLKFLQPTLMNADVVNVIDNHVRFGSIIRMGYPHRRRCLSPPKPWQGQLQHAFRV